MKKTILLLAAFAVVAASLISCGKEKKGMTAATAVKGSGSGSVILAHNNNTQDVSTFAYKTGDTYHIIFCEGSAMSWDAALKKPYVILDIREDLIREFSMSSILDSVNPYLAGVESGVGLKWDPHYAEGYYVVDADRLTPSDKGVASFTDQASVNVTKMGGNYIFTIMGDVPFGVTNRPEYYQGLTVSPDSEWVGASSMFVSGQWSYDL